MKRRLLNAVDCLPWACLLGVWLASFVYAKSPLQEVVWCVWRRLFSLACPGCGLTRSFCAMSAGDWADAFHHHLAGPFLYAAMVWCIVVWPARYITGNKHWLALGRMGLAIYWGATLVLFLGQTARVVRQWLVEIQV